MSVRLSSLTWVVVAFLIVEVSSRFAITRLVLKEVARLFTLMELWAIGLVRAVVRPRHELRGQCHKCGACCQQIIADPPRLVKTTFLLRLFLGYHARFHGFEAVARGPDGQIILGCSHVGADGRCGVYRYRPLLCRNYPIRTLFVPPTVLPGCGYWSAPRVVLRMKNRDSLPIVNPCVAVHHPTPVGDDEPLPEHFKLIEE